VAINIRIMKTFIFLLVMIILPSCGAADNTQAQSFKSLSAKEFNAFAEAGTEQLLDVRRSAEFAEGHLQGALLANVQDSVAFEAVILTLDKTKKVLVYCHSGRRSAHAVSILASKGFEVLNLKGGIIEWKEAGYSVVK